ncbi:hypothetical protein KCTCHS21_47630 [Cohnella abietis]|uniref:Uncharacterized protein n=1 Tax=Cohnella abietis TaxID=2507935 RepID=A0A3T1DBE4_9BACL|nr:hypothetical protein KCTCHS21_47630 [Cohnella abietis]
MIGVAIGWLYKELSRYRGRMRGFFRVLAMWDSESYLLCRVSRVIWLCGQQGLIGCMFGCVG